MPRKTTRTTKQRRAWKKVPKWLRAKFRQSPLAKWAAKIRREYNFVCARCSSNINLEAHHCFFKAIYPKLKLDIDNGLCLCTECHDILHTLFISDEQAYWLIVSELVKLRKPIKRLKNRNPSGYNYKEYTGKLPKEFMEKPKRKIRKDKGKLRKKPI